MDTYFPHLDVGSGRHIGALTLFPVWTDAPAVRGLNWRLSDLTVGELTTGAQVDRLMVENESPKPTVLIEGDLLAGGLQHRMAAASLVVPSSASMPIDVVCVEQGRWSGGAMHRAEGRRGTLRTRRSAVDRRQGGVWGGIGDYDEAFGRSTTSSMLDHLARVEGPSVDLMPGQRGVIVGVGGRVLGLELFGSTAGLRARWAGLVSAAGIDARLAPTVRTESWRAREFVRALARLDLEPEWDLGVERINADGDRFRVSGISLAASPIHLMAFDDSHPVLAAA